MRLQQGGILLSYPLQDRPDQQPSVANSDVDISSWVELLHHFSREILEEFDLAAAIVKKLGQVPLKPHFLEGDTPYHSGIFNRRSNFAVTSWNNRYDYVSLLPIAHGSTCLKQRYSRAMETILQTLLSTDCDAVYCRYLQWWSPAVEITPSSVNCCITDNPIFFSRYMTRR